MHLHSVHKEYSKTKNFKKQLVQVPVKQTVTATEPYEASSILRPCHDSNMQWYSTR